MPYRPDIPLMVFPIAAIVELDVISFDELRIIVDLDTVARIKVVTFP